MGQEFSIKKLELLNDGVALHYDLVDTTKDRTYTVYLYSSVDKFISPLAKVSGDAGLQVRPGLNKKIVWSTREEYGPTFSGDLELEIRGHLYVAFLRMEKFNEVQKRKRSFLVKWSGGSKQNILNFQLYRADGKLGDTYANVANTGETKIEIPTSVKPGKGYYFRVSDSKNKDQMIQSQTFEIRRKYPLAVTATLAAGLGYLIYWALPDKDVEGPPDVPK